MLFNIYIFVLPVIFMFLFYSLYLIRFSPNKIKVLGSTAIALMIVRYICIFIMLVAPSILNLYILKIPYFLNFVGIPIIIFTITYVFLRRNRINFNYMFLFALIAVIIYILTMYNCSVVIRDINDFGYSMFFESNMLVYWIYIIFNTLVLFGSIAFSAKSNVNKLGLYITSFSAFITIIEYLSIIINVNFFPESIFGELCFVMALVYALTKLRK